MKLVLPGLYDELTTVNFLLNSSDSSKGEKTNLCLITEKGTLESMMHQSKRFFQMASSMSCSTPENMKPPQRLCVADNFNHPFLGHATFRSISFRQFQVDQNSVELKELNA